MDIKSVSEFLYMHVQSFQHYLMKKLCLLYYTWIFFPIPHDFGYYSFIESLEVGL